MPHQARVRPAARTAALVLSLAVGLVGTLGPAAAATAVDTARLRQAVTVDGVRAHLDALQQIADDHGGTRASGTPGYDASADYVAGQLADAGYRVTRQVFEFDTWSEVGTPVMEQLSPTAKSYTYVDEFLMMVYSRGGDVTGALVPTNDIVWPPTVSASSNSGCEAGDFPSTVGGQIALIQRGTCDFSVKAANAQAAGYVAAVIFNEGNPSDPDRVGVIGGTLGADSTATIPIFETTDAIGGGWVEAIRGGATVTLHLQGVVDIRFDVPTENVIAETPGGRDDRVVVVGAHLDSVPAGPGINDNGSGTATILEIALQMKKLAIQPTNKVRFAFWGAEEAGLIGSAHYVGQLSKDQIKRIMVNLNFDMVGSPNYVRFVYDGDGDGFALGTAGPNGSGNVEAVFADYFRAQDLAFEPTEFDGRSDYDAFIDVGIPAGGLFTGAEGVKTAQQAAVYGGTAGVAYDPCYHQACDTTANLSNRALDEMADAAAHATLTFALTTSSVNGTDKGKATGRFDRAFDHQGPHARR